MESTQVVPPSKAGWRLQEWLPAAAISRTTFYRLSPEERPPTIKVGRAVVIVESPAAWVARIAQRQAAAAMQAAIEAEAKRLGGA